MITCEQCLKTVGSGEVGGHRICDDCKVTEPERKPDDNEQKREEGR